MNAPPRLDAHLHLWQYRAAELPWIGEGMEALARDHLPVEVLPLLRAGGFEGGIAVQARPSVAETDWLLGLATAHPRIAGVVGWADLASPSVGESLARWRAAGPLVGVRAMVQDAPDPAALLEDAAFNRGVAEVQSQGLVYDVLVRAPQLSAALAFCRRHDRHWIVLDHAGKPDIRGQAAQGGVDVAWAAEVRALAALPHVVCKLSGLVTEAWVASEAPGVAATPSAAERACARSLPYGRRALDAFGADRLMFGSDWPVCTLAASHAAVTALAEAVVSGASAGERAAVFGGTAQRCYGLAAVELEAAWT